jgi:hypothetical protein
LAAQVFTEKLYLLSPEALYVFHIQSWKEAVDQLIIAGNWLDALAIALENFRKGISFFSKFWIFLILLKLVVESNHRVEQLR